MNKFVESNKLSKFIKEKNKNLIRFLSRKGSELATK